MAEQQNSHGETVWWNSGTVVVEQCGGTVEQYGKTVKQLWYKMGGGTVEQ